MSLADLESMATAIACVVGVFVVMVVVTSYFTHKFFNEE